MVSLTMFYKPLFAQLLQSEKRGELADHAVRMCRYAVLFSAGLFLPILFYRDGIMSFIFGAEYASGGLALVILMFGQVVISLTAAVTYVLTMSGMENAFVRIMLVTVAVNLVLNLVLVPPLAGAGAAIASVISIAILNAGAWRHVRRELAIDCSVLGLPLRKTTSQS